VTTHPWRDCNAIYQIYPRSFQDTNADGIGDIPGVISRLDYLKTLTDIIWLSPMYQSPQKDFGYDVSSFTDIAPEYGTMQDFERLISHAHARGMKVFMDFVPNHTSDQHEWFKESRSSRDNPKRDWYVWCDSKNGAEPNNWVSLAGGKSWEFDEQTGQYYLHSWLKSQPDLNWENPAVRAAMNEAMRYWLNRGVDGFRVDAVWVMAKDPDLADDPLRPGGDSLDYGGYLHTKCRNGARLNEYLGSMIETVAEYGGMLVIEYYSTPEFGDSYEQLYSLQSINPAVCTVFFFDPLHWQFTARAMGEGIAAYLSGLPKGALPVFCFGNHDQTRIVTRFGGEAQARLVATLQLTLPGLPCVYNGEELGMKDGYIPAGEGQDGFGSDGMMAGRDPERTPMQWDDTDYAGFSTVKPWLPVSESYRTINVAQESLQPESMLALYRTLLHLRRQSATLRQGQYTLLGCNNNILSYEVSDQSAAYGVMVNFNNANHEVLVQGGHIVCSSIMGNSANGLHGNVVLAPYEAIVIKKES